MSVKHKMQKASVGFGAAFTECSTEKESESPQVSERPPKVARRGCVRRSSTITKKCPRWWALPRARIQHWLAQIALCSMSTERTEIWAVYCCFCTLWKCFKAVWEQVLISWLYIVLFNQLLPNLSYQTMAISGWISCFRRIFKKYHLVKLFARAAYLVTKQ